MRDTTTTHRVRRIVRRVAPMVVATALGPWVVGCTGDGSSGESGGAPTDFCADVEAFEALQAEGDALFESSEDVPVERLRDVFSRFRDTVESLMDSAPEAVADDAALVGTTTEDLIDAYERADFDFVVLATDPQYAEVLAGLDDDRITEANDRLAVFFREECGAG